MKSLNRKKTVLLTIAICLSFLLLFPQAAFAAGGVKLSASTESGITGEEITVTINITNALDTEGGQFDLSYDPAIIEPKKDSGGDYLIEEGKFVSDANSSLLMSNVVDDTIKVAWITPEGDTANSGVVCTIVFKLLDDGNVTLTFSELIMAPDGVVIDTPTSGVITVISVAAAKQAAIDAADAAIADLPDPDDIELTDKDDVEAARALVEVAKDDHDAVDSDFEDLEKLVDVEEMIDKLEAIKTADDAILALPSVDSLKLDDKPDVVAARALVNKAKDDHDAVDADFTYLARLTAAENRIKELEGLQPTPPTGGVQYLILIGLVIVITGAMVYYRRSRLVAE